MLILMDEMERRSCDADVDGCQWMRSRGGMGC
jgi:hypothetical protein